eukprot:Nitzschia sp. Nitz4//scaffold28_size193895//4148//5491//NITZ4_001619-RA/size193895-processed-gene-0.210-mRNA-1//1//CDS//3329545844//4171//frame0
MGMNSLYLFLAGLILQSVYTSANNQAGLIKDVPTSRLTNGKDIPLVGLGVGNLPHNQIEAMISEALKDENKIRLIDTAHASRNEHIVSSGIVSGANRWRASGVTTERFQVHVVTKVWYTYLGYNRTVLSVTESLEELQTAIDDPNVDLKVHILIHWPRCYDTIPWMNCVEEEENLPTHVRQAGPPPHMDRENAWRQSWKALEDIYNSGDYPAIASIGISNFSDEDLKALMNFAKVAPHVIQINIWSLAFDMSLVDMCYRHGIHMQLYNVMNGVLGSAFATPHAHHHLLQVANLVHKRLPDGSPAVTAAQVVLKWLVQFDMSVIPRTSNNRRLSENSAVSLEGVPQLLERELEIVAQATAAMVSGKDLAEDAFVHVTFVAETEDMYLYFLAGEEDHRRVAFIPKGNSYEESTHPHHRFRLYHATNPDKYHDYVVEAKYGDQKEVRVEL